MKRFSNLLGVIGIVLLAACDKRPAEAGAGPGPNISSPEDVALMKNDIPLLPVKVGDRWTYGVSVEIAPGVTAPDAGALEITSERVRTFLGKVSPGAGFPEADCFEVTAEETPTEREFVEIREDRVLLRGSVKLVENARPVWYETPVPFVIAGLRAGSKFHEIRVGEGESSRQIQVVGREEVTVPAGDYEAVRLLMVGQDGEFELRRTIWFSPGKGIVREEKARYAKDKLLFREIQELREFRAGDG